MMNAQLLNSSVDTSMRASSAVAERDDVCSKRWNPQSATPLLTLEFAFVDNPTSLLNH